MSNSLDIDIRCDGLVAEMARAEQLLRDLGGLKEQKAFRVALRNAISAARQESARVARTFYTARKSKIFDSVEVKYAEGKLTLRAKPGMSLIHFKPNPATPGKAPAGGVTSQVKRGGPRYAHRDRRFDHVPPLYHAQKTGWTGHFRARNGAQIQGLEGRSHALWPVANPVAPAPGQSGAGGGKGTGDLPREH